MPFAHIVKITIKTYKIVETNGFASAWKVIFLCRPRALQSFCDTTAFCCYPAWIGAYF